MKLAQVLKLQPWFRVRFLSSWIRRLRSDQKITETLHLQRQHWIESATSEDALCSTADHRWASRLLWSQTVLALAAAGMALFQHQPSSALHIVIAFLVLLLSSIFWLWPLARVRLSTVQKSAAEETFWSSPEMPSRLASLAGVAFKKTGVITIGQPRVIDIQPHRDQAETTSNILRLAAALEQTHERPIGSAIVEAAKRAGVVFDNVRDVEYMEGGGLTGMRNGQRVCVGNTRLLQRFGVELPKSVADDKDLLESEGKSVVLVSEGERLLGALALSDALRAEAEATVSMLSACGVVPALITGDSVSTSSALAKRIGIRRVFSERTPMEQNEDLQRFHKEVGPVAIVVHANRRPPDRTGADIEITLGLGSHPAINENNVSILSGRLEAVSAIVCRFKKEKRLLRRIRLGLSAGTLLIWAAAYGIILFL